MKNTFVILMLLLCTVHFAQIKIPNYDETTFNNLNYKNYKLINLDDKIGVTDVRNGTEIIHPLYDEIRLGDYIVAKNPSSFYTQ